MIKNIQNYIKGSIAFLLLFVFTSGSAQIYLSGVVSDTNTNAVVPGHTVFINVDTSNQQVYYISDTVQTNGQGVFIDTVTPPIGTLVKFYISTYDCNSVLKKDSLYSVYPIPINLSICTGGINLCLSDFIAYPDTSNSQQIHFFNLSSSNITNSMWSFGDGNYSSQMAPTHTYNYGTYEVCLSVDDTVSGCGQTYCDSLKVSPIMDCNNNINFIKLTPKKFSFTGNVNGLYPTLYYWDFGDGSFANGKTIIHEYLQPGYYDVTLNTTSIHPQTLDTCMSSSTSTIHATGNPTAGLWGQVFADDMEIDHGKVYIYSFDENSLSLSLVDSTNVINNDSIGLGSYYEFIGLTYGKYVAYLKLKPNSIFCESYAPAYSGNTIYWNDSYIIDLNKISTAMPINLTHTYPLNGGSTISGFAYEGSKANPGDPKKDVPIYLLDQNIAVVDFTFTQSDGSYSFDSLTIQNYYVYSDVINHQIFPAKVDITSNNENINSINVYISSNSVTSVSDKNNFSFKVFPKPANNILNISFPSIENVDISCNIFNVVGQKVLSYKLHGNENSLNYKIDVSSLKCGIYFLKITKNNMNSHVEKIIISK